MSSSKQVSIMADRTEYMREYMRRYRAEHPDVNRNASRRYREQYPDRVKEQNHEQYLKRKARKEESHDGS